MFQRFMKNTIDATDCPRHADIHPFDAIAFEGGPTLSQARRAHSVLLDTINLEISRKTGGGSLVAVPICATACLQGDISDFLITLQCDPFSRANMMYFASDAKTAEALDTLSYDAVFDTKYDAEMVAFYRRAMAGWDDFKAVSLDASRIDVLNHRDMFRKMFCETASRIEAMTFAGKCNLWRKQFGEKIAA